MKQGLHNFNQVQVCILPLIAISDRPPLFKFKILYVYQVVLMYTSCCSAGPCRYTVNVSTRRLEFIIIFQLNTNYTTEVSAWSTHWYLETEGL
jgi:hypothetical protein